MICGNCKKPAATVATVRACYAGDAAPCDWRVLAYDEDGAHERPCGAHAVFDDRGWACEAGHSHVYAEARHAEGWDYANDATEAARMAVAGVAAVGMDGCPF